MDPTATLRDARYSIDCDEPSEAIALLKGYFEWRLKGGFEPVAPLHEPLFPSGDSPTGNGDACAFGLMDEMSDIFEKSGM